MTPGHDGFRPPSSLFSETVLEDLYRYQVQKAPVRPLCHLSNPLADLAGNHFVFELRELWPAREPDTSRFCTTLPRPCGAAYSPALPQPHFDGCEPADVITRRSDREPAWSDTASQLV